MNIDSSLRLPRDSANIEPISSKLYLPEAETQADFRNVHVKSKFEKYMHPLNIATVVAAPI